MALWFPNIESANQGGITFIHEDDAPEFSRACWDELKADHLRKQRDAALAEVERLRGFIGDFADAYFAPAGRMCPTRAPYDEEDPVTDYYTVIGWQEDARNVLKPVEDKEAAE